MEGVGTQGFSRIQFNQHMFRKKQKKSPRGHTHVQGNEILEDMYTVKIKQKIMYNLCKIMF